jgi:tetratricopeptide (TPR) repeat protein
MHLGEHADDALVARARNAIGGGDWHEALGLLQAVEAGRELSSPEVELLAQAAYGSGDLEAAVEAWELLHTRCTASNDPVGAARAATTVALHLMIDTGLMAPVRGWATRAERLLDGQDESEVHAWLAVVRTYERFMSGDLEPAERWARDAIDIGVRQHAPAPTAIGRVAMARLVISAGNVDEGLRLLDEVAIATVSGELDPLSVGIVYCELICAMQGLAQYDRAEEWTDAMERWRRGNAFGGINGRCRVHRAEILRLRGSCSEAEDEILHACEELRPWMRREYGWPLTELGTIRLRRGDLVGAEEAFVAAHENGWDPQPGLALLRLAQGAVPAALALITHALDHPSNLPSKERPPYGGLRRAPLLDGQAEIAVAAGDIPLARKAAEELSEIAEMFRSRALAASAALARGRVALAEGDASTGVRESEEAVGAWIDVGAPYEASVARLALAQAHRALGQEDRAILELRAARSTFERIEAVLRAEEATRACGDAPPAGEPTGRALSPPETGTVEQCLFRLEGDTRSVVYAGEAVLLRDLKGMRYIARLLAEHGREFHVIDLVAAERGAPLVLTPAITDQLSASLGGDAGPVLDARAKEAYRRRLQEIEDDIDEATLMGDIERAALAKADHDYLVRELSRAFGLGGRERRAGATSERARASVARTLRYAMDRIAEHHQSLAEHLRQTLQTGTYCGYFPDPRVPINWET